MKKGVKADSEGRKKRMNELIRKNNEDSNGDTHKYVCGVPILGFYNREYNNVIRIAMSVST